MVLGFGTTVPQKENGVRAHSGGFLAGTSAQHIAVHEWFWQCRKSDFFLRNRNIELLLTISSFKKPNRKQPAEFLIFEYIL